METTRVSTKGQVVLPKAMRDAHAWVPGTELVVEDTPAGILLRPVKKGPFTRLEDVAGCLKHKGKPKTLKDFERAIDLELKSRHARGRY